MKDFSLISGFFALMIWNVAAERRIYRGTITNIKEFPYMVMIFDGGVQICAGSILSESFILTAAHCIRNSKDMRRYTAVYGTTTPAIRGSGGVVVNLTKWRPCYLPDGGLIDASVLETEETMYFSRVARPIVLSMDEVPYIYRGIMAGWGVTEDDAYSSVLLSVNVTLFSQVQCKYVIDHLVLRSFEFCGKAAYLKGPCSGDSGSPVVGFENRRQYGIFVRNRVCGIENYPEKFTHVGSIKECIDKNSNYTAKWASDFGTPPGPPNYPPTTEQPKVIQNCKCRNPYFSGK